MNYQSTDRTDIRLPDWLSCAVLLAGLALVSPVSVQIVFAQEIDSGLTVAIADEGQPPSPIAGEGDFKNPLSAESAAAIETVPEIATSEITNQAELSALASDSTLPATEESTLSNPAGVRSLSVEPGSRPLLPEDRPTWVGASPELSSNQHYLYVGSIPVSSASEAETALDEPLVAAVHTYIDEEVIRKFGASQAIPVDAGFIRKNLIDDPSGYLAELSTSEGSMYQKWVKVRITPEQRQQFHVWHKQAMQRERLGPLGTVLFLLVGSVALSHLVLRRWHGPANLPVVNHQTAQEPHGAIASSAGSLTWLWVTFFCILVLPALFLLSFVGIRSSRTVITTGGHNAVQYFDEMPFTPPKPPSPPKLNIGRDIRVETGNGTRAIIIHDQSHK